MKLCMKISINYLRHTILSMILEKNSKLNIGNLKEKDQYKNYYEN